MQMEQRNRWSHSWHSVLKVRDDRVARVGEHGENHCASACLAVTRSHVLDQLVRHPVESSMTSPNHLLHSLDHKKFIWKPSARDMATNADLGPLGLDGSELTVEIIPTTDCVIDERGPRQ